jgi:TfoX/Sxy family transcriptional regulator of competence genes
MVASADFAEFLKEQLAPLGYITMRRMFGKTGVFCDGLMLGMVTDNMLYLRVDDENREAFEEAASSPPLNYQKQGSMIDSRSGAPRNGCTTNPTSLSTGRELRWRQRGGLRRSANGRRRGDQGRCEAGKVSRNTEIT